MKVGINLVNFGPAARPEVLARWAELAERLGYHSLLTSDHLAVTPDVQERYPGPFYEPLTILGWLAALTDRVELGTTVTIVPYRSPFEVARAWANLDNLSGGRMILGVGVGWAEREFEALDVPFGRRGAITDDYLAVIRAHWATERLDWDGPFVSCQGVDTTPLPMRAPLPVWVGGSSRAALRRTVRLGTAWHPIRLRPSWFTDVAVPRLAEVADREGMPMPELCPRIMFAITPHPTDPATRFMGHGTLEQIHGDLHLLEQAGCAHVILDPYSPFDDIGLRDLVMDPEPALERTWEAYETVAATVIDLQAESVR